MKVYISIPISGHDMNAQTVLAALVAFCLRMRGHVAFNPFAVHAPEELDEKRQYAYCMGEDVKELLCCDAILMVDKRWPRSKGCSIEHFIAERMGMEIFYDLTDIPANNGDKSNKND